MSRPRCRHSSTSSHTCNLVFQGRRRVREAEGCGFPEILRQKRRDGTIRIWSAGCSTGEETYSLLIALLEFLAQEDASDVPVQVFGTDISEKAIEKARAGFYPDGALRDVSAERLTRFYQGGGWRIQNQQIRAPTVRVREARPRSGSALFEA